jgi:hypothetical protein
VAIGVAAFYVLAPVAVRLGSRQAPQLGLEEVPTEFVETLGPEAQGFVTESERALREDGFERVALVTTTDLAPGARCVFVLMTNRTVGARGLVAFVIGLLEGSPSVTQKWVAFSTHFGDGTIVETGNLDEVTVLEPRLRQDPRSFPEVKGPRALFRIHQARVARIEDRATVLPAPGEEIALMTREYAADMQRQVEVGYLEPDPEGPMLRPTWRGAWVMTMKLVPPGRWLEQWSRQRENARLRAELGLQSS